MKYHYYLINSDRLFTVVKSTDPDASIYAIIDMLIEEGDDCLSFVDEETYYQSLNEEVELDYACVPYSWDEAKIARVDSIHTMDEVPAWYEDYDNKVYTLQ